MKNKLKNCWSTKPEKEDYAAAEQFLTLLFDEKKATKLVNKLKKTRRSKPITKRS